MSTGWLDSASRWVGLLVLKAETLDGIVIAMTSHVEDVEVQRFLETYFFGSIDLYFRSCNPIYHSGKIIIVFTALEIYMYKLHCEAVGSGTFVLEA